MNIIRTKTPHEDPITAVMRRGKLFEFSEPGGGSKKKQDFKSHKKAKVFLEISLLFLPFFYIFFTTKEIAYDKLLVLSDAIRSTLNRELELY